MARPYRPKYRRKDGSIALSRVWWIKYYQDGRPIRESTETTKESVARRILRLRQGDVEHGIPINPKMNRITFEEAAKDLLNDYAVNRRRSVDGVARRVKKHLTPFFGRRRLAWISTSDIRDYIAERQADTIVTRKARKVMIGAKLVEISEQTKPVSNAEINRELSALKRMFRLAVQAGQLHAMPHIPMLQEDNVRRGFFEYEQFRDVRNHLPKPLQAVVMFAYLTGWRLASEILPLEWRQVDWSGRVVRLDPGTTKNREGRTFPFTAALEQLLKNQLAEYERLKKAGRVVPLIFHRDGERIRDFRGAWRSACTAAGVPGRILHDFRRTAVRNLERAGVSRSAAMAMVGHKTEAIYRRYAIADADALREAAAKIDRAANG